MYERKRLLHKLFRKELGCNWISSLKFNDLSLGMCKAVRNLLKQHFQSDIWSPLEQCPSSPPISLQQCQRSYLTPGLWFQPTFSFFLNIWYLCCGSHMILACQLLILLPVSIIQQGGYARKRTNILPRKYFQGITVSCVAAFHIWPVFLNDRIISIYLLKKSLSTDVVM